MESWIDITFELDDTSVLTVCRHDNSISLSLPGYAAPQHYGFAVYFRPVHVDLLRQMIADLEGLASVQEAALAIASTRKS